MRKLGLGDYAKVYNSPNVLLGYGHLQNGNIIYDTNGKDIDHLSRGIDALNSYPLWGFSDKETKEKFGDDINLQNHWLQQFFKYNWSFLDKYILGISNHISLEKTRYQEWYKKYSTRLI
jgi:hypothetical protein